MFITSEMYVYPIDKKRKEICHSIMNSKFNSIGLYVVD